MAKIEKMVSVNNVRLRYAREYYGLSLHEVAEKLKIKLENLEKYENGEDYPSYSQLDRLSTLYDRPSLYFFFPETSPHDDELAIAFRSAEKNIGTQINVQTRKMIERASLYRLNLSEMYENQEVPIFEELLLADSVNEQSLASWLRKKINLSLEKQKEFTKTDKLLEYLREQLYGIGIYVFKDTFKEDSVSGLCLYDDKFPIILLNNKTTFNRQVFTLFHEVYHIFKKEIDVYLSQKGDEKACDKFAGEFLIPDEDFELKLKNVDSCENEDFIVRLANDYKVSTEAVAYKLFLKKRITRNFYLSIRDEGIRKMNKGTSGGNFYYTRISYLGKSYLKQVFNDYHKGNITAITVGKYTGVKTAHVKKLSSSLFGGEL